MWMRAFLIIHGLFRNYIGTLHRIKLPYFVLISYKEYYISMLEKVVCTEPKAEEKAN
jgi:hypothetical protein